jgi:hypothetical protein
VAREAMALRLTNMNLLSMSDSLPGIQHDGSKPRCLRLIACADPLLWHESPWLIWRWLLAGRGGEVISPGGEVPGAA